MIPTIKVKRDGPKGYRLINASDFDPAKHELFDTAELTEPTEGPTKEGLQAKCVELGIEFDARWGVKRLQQVLAE